MNSGPWASLCHFKHVYDDDNDVNLLISLSRAKRGSRLSLALQCSVHIFVTCSCLYMLSLTDRKAWSEEIWRARLKVLYWNAKQTLHGVDSPTAPLVSLSVVHLLNVSSLLTWSLQPCQYCSVLLLFNWALILFKQNRFNFILIIWLTGLALKKAVRNRQKANDCVMFYTMRVSG